MTIEQKLRGYIENRLYPHEADRLMLIEAADEIARLRKENIEMRDALINIGDAIDSWRG